MALDPVTNFAVVEVSTGYDASATSIALASGEGAKLPQPSSDGSFNLVWYNATDYAAPHLDPNKEIVRCTARSTDTLTVTRAQEGTSGSTKNTASKTYVMVLAPTKKLRDDLNATTRSIVLTAAGGWPSTTAGSATNTKVEYTTNDQDIYHLDFDQTTDENAQWTIVMPDSYDGGTITAQVYWTANSTSTNSVVWGVQGRAYADGDALDASWGTAVTVTDANGSSANTLRISSATSAITLAGTPAGGQVAQIRVYRDADNGSDTLAADARLIAIKIEYTTSSYND